MLLAQRKEPCFIMKCCYMINTVGLFHSSTGVESYDRICQILATNVVCVPLSHNNQWIYSTASSTQVTAVCQKEIILIDLNGSGLLTVNHCILKHNRIHVTGRYLISTTFSYTSHGELTVMNTSTIETYGETTKFLDIGLRRKFAWAFVIAFVSQLIHGANFVASYNILINILTTKYVDDMMNLTRCHTITAITDDVSKISLINNSLPFNDILEEFKDMTEFNKRTHF
uniref:Uncharacterized protein n=1 Tax=Glossina austeni TaxID=7395 RepID=A0A1A9UIC4_GLOAU